MKCCYFSGSKKCLSEDYQRSHLSVGFILFPSRHLKVSANSSLFDKAPITLWLRYINIYNYKFNWTLFQHLRQVIRSFISPWPQKNRFAWKWPTIFFNCTICILSFLFFFCVHKISIHCFVIELQYNHVLILWH